MRILRLFKSEFSALTGDLPRPFLALMVALGGVTLAWVWINEENHSCAIGVIIVGMLLGRGCEWTGILLLPKYPKQALYFMEFSVISPALVAAVASGAIVLISIALSPPEGVSVETKQVLTTLSAGISAFLTAGFLGWTGEKGDSKLANRIRGKFQEKYQRHIPQATKILGVHYFKADSPGERWVYSGAYRGISGWGREARKKRAQGLADELKSRGSNP